MQVNSTAFHEGQTIPPQFTADGTNVSPPLYWSGAPPKTKSFVVICEDPDAPRGTWVHWILFNLPSDLKELPMGVPVSGTIPQGGVQGKNDFGNLGYGGPSPPKGKPHRYFFRVYALDTVLEHAQGITRNQLEQAMKGHVLDRGQLLGHYRR